MVHFKALFSRERVADPPELRATLREFSCHTVFSPTHMKSKRTVNHPTLTFRLLTALTVLLASLASTAIAQRDLPIPPPFLEIEEEAQEPPPPASIDLVELARASDVIALTQVDVTDYERRQTLPVSGNAWLKQLIRYKSNRSNPGLLRVAEEGLGEQKCYFESKYFDENARFLVFLQYNDELSRYQGHPVECALPVLVTEDGSYALRWPMEHIDASAELQALVQPLDFVGPGSRIPVDELDYRVRDAWVEDGWARVEDRTVMPTHGVMLSDARRLFRDALDSPEQAPTPEEVLELTAPDP